MYLEMLSSECFSVGKSKNGPISKKTFRFTYDEGEKLHHNLKFEALDLYQLALAVMYMIGLFECDNQNVCPVTSHVF